MSEALHKFLNVQIANFSVLHEKVHHYHWYVKGGPFFSIHSEFRNDYQTVTQYVDDLAERLIIVGGKPSSSLKEYLRDTTLVENQGEATTAQKMAKGLVADFKQLQGELKEGIEQFGEAGDPVTEDILIGMLTYIEERIWHWEAFLGHTA
ncbi:DNA starvation/stationary phase protection protein (plasmid) [Pontibacillus sp. ALD_SL1]|uniref:Dps family protein n=1 Tax=Pontibacillus sp. ALD_SL1 TaxID=2777185 RepID=UPI001A95D019|nr:DNA starvation/stationary phase protection protein [Pontibacillus sp. ALD_SL1]QST02433.1 DNA starvation/stationary phase protection protein [Pontibacillus sp. ALD_SL1]